MKKIKRPIRSANRAHHGLALLMAVLLLTQTVWSAAAQTPTPSVPDISAQKEPLARTGESPEAGTASESASKGEPDVASSDLLFRTRIELDDAYKTKRLEALGVSVLERDGGSALVLVDFDQLEALARLGFRPTGTDNLAALTSAHASSKPWLATSLAPLLAGAASVDASLSAKTDKAAVTRALAPLTKLVAALSVEQLAGVASMTSLDDDLDGLTNTEEAWWCTDSLNSDTDSDGATDGQEIQALRDWMANKRASAPGETPWPSWPFNDTTCPDKDSDSVPNLTERWDLGLNMDLESTDWDKFDDGQELFGVTYCPGSDTGCGYGAYPPASTSSSIVMFPGMPGFVKAPGNHPLVAAFPVIDVDVVPDNTGKTFYVEAATTITTDHTIGKGTQRSYTTSIAQGTNTSVENTVSWDNYVEIGESVEQKFQAQGQESVAAGDDLCPLGCGFRDDYFKKAIAEASKACNIKIGENFQGGITIGKEGLGELGLSGGYGYQNQLSSKFLDPRCEAAMQRGRAMSPDFKAAFPEQSSDVINNFAVDNNVYNQIDNNVDVRVDPQVDVDNQVVVNNVFDTQGIVRGLDGIALSYRETGELLGKGLYQISSGLGQINGSLNDISKGIGDMSGHLGDIANILAAPTKTNSTVNGTSHGGAQSTSHTTTEEHTITDGQAFLSDESWGTATAVDSSRAAELWFTYEVRNTGTEYAAEVRNLAFNIYIGNNSNPACTYYVGSTTCGVPVDTVVYSNLMPGGTTPVTSFRIPLTLSQMQAVDLGGPVRIVVASYAYGTDQVFAQAIASSDVVLAIEDGEEDGDSTIDRFSVATWGDKSLLDALASYFPHTTDSEGDLVALWTPEYRSDTPSWCREPNRTGTTLWCKHALSTADWWDIYMSEAAGEGQGYEDAPARPGSTALFRFNRDSDWDGYSDRSEVQLGTKPDDRNDFPRPELIAGLSDTRNGNQVTTALSVLNTGLADAYAVEAVMLSPDATTTVVTNTVGGSGRVRGGSHVIVGSKISLADPLPSAWTQPGHAQPAVAGYFTAATPITYTFTVQCGTAGGCKVGEGSWGLNWADTASHSGSLPMGSGYQSPSFQDVGSNGVKLALYSGQVQAGENFKVFARPPLSSFRYNINSEPYTPPVVIVSYNDPQGNHRFIIPAASSHLSSPAADLLPFAGQMAPEPGVEIVATATISVGVNTTNLVVSNPLTNTTFSDAHLHLELVSDDGKVAFQTSRTLNLPPGPSVVPVDWDTSHFSPAFASNRSYYMLAFLTDHQESILDNAAQPFTAFYSDSPMKIALPQPTAAVGTVLHADSYATLATLLGASHAAGPRQTSSTYTLRGSAGQPTVGARMAGGKYRASSGFVGATARLQERSSAVATVAAAPSAPTDVIDRYPVRCFPLTNTGRHPLKLRAVATDPALTITQPPAPSLESGQFTQVCARLNTDTLPNGPFDRSLPVYTSDPIHPVVELHLTGAVQPSGQVVFVYNYEGELRPLNKILHVNSARAAGETVRYPHGVSGDTGQLEPLYVYGDAETGTPLGRGTALGGSTARQAPGDSSATDLTLPQGTSVRRDYTVQYGYKATLSSGGQVTYEAPIASQGYATVTLDIVTHPLAAAHVSLSLDVADDGSTEWSYTGDLDPAEDAVTASGAGLATAVSAYVKAHPGTPVPIRLTTDVAGTYFLSNIRATPSVDADLAFAGPLEISNTSPVETETIQLCATSVNHGAGDVATSVSDFIVGLPAVNASILIDYAAIGKLSANSGESRNCVDWDTTGFTGDVVLYGVTDYLGQVAESDEANNVISRTLTIRSRPDLLVTSIALADDEPMAGETVTATLSLKNGGQTNAVPSTVSLYDGDPSSGGVLLGTKSIAGMAANGTASASFSWSPSTAGQHRLFARVDEADAVDEFDESNNATWREVEVGFASPILMDSGQSATDPAYSPTTGYGAVDNGQADVSSGCGSDPYQTYRQDPDGKATYRFDHLLPGHYYHLDLTLYECGSSAGRQEVVRIDDQQIAGPENLGDGQVHRLSLLIDPAFYANDGSMTVVVQETQGGLGALVNEINLYDVDYRYSDSGGSSDPQYPGPANIEKPYGWLDGSSSNWGPLPYQTARVDQLDNKVRYRYDGLNKALRYRLAFSFFQGNGSDRQQQIWVDGVNTGQSVNVIAGQQATLSVPVPVETYYGDGIIEVAVQRTNATTGAMVNEIALEQRTVLNLPKISDIRLSNVSDTGVTLSWLTDVAAGGMVHYGTTTALGKTAQDLRGVGSSTTTHFVNLTGLTANATYYYYLNSGDTVDDNGGAYYTLKTGPKLSPPTSDSVYGPVMRSDGTTPATGALVYLTLKDANGQGTAGQGAPRAALVDSGGYWNVDLSATRTTDSSAYFKYSSSGDRLNVYVTTGECSAEQEVDTASDSPAATLILVCPTTVTHDLEIGWNLLGPNVETSGPTRAEAALDDIATQGGDATEVDRWLNGGWDAHVHDLPFNDFTLELGKGYFFRAESSKTWQRYGKPPATPLPLNLYPGWNLVSFPKLNTTLTAESLLSGIATQGGACSEADRWNAGAWEGHPKGVPFNNFTIATNEGYFVKCSTTSVYDPGRASAAASSEFPAPPAPVEAPAATVGAAITDVRVTNLRDVAVAISWRTNTATTGRVIYLKEGGAELVEYDDLGRDAASTLHHVTLTGLVPGATYHFTLWAGESAREDESFAFNTLPPQRPRTPTVAYGQVQRPDGSAAVGGLAYLTSGGGKTFEPLSALIDGWGYWNIDVPLDQCEGVDLRLQVLAPDGSAGSATFPACQAAPGPVVQTALQERNGTSTYLPVIVR